MGKDYYSILGVSRDADDETIKKAYRKLGKVISILNFFFNVLTNLE